MSTIPQHFEELELIAEKAGELNDRVGKIETEWGAQTKTLESAALVLDAAIKGLGALKTSVLENSLGALQLDVNDKTAHLGRELARFEVAVTELDKRSVAGDTEIKAALSETAKELRTKFDAKAAELAEWSGKVELTIAEHAKALAAIPPVIRGADAATFNPRGEWASGVVAQKLDVMSYAGTSYVSNEDGNNETPPKSKKWTVLAKRAGSIAMGGVGDFAGLAGITRPNQIASGVNAWAIGDVLYANTGSTLKNLAPDTSGKFLQTQGAGAAPVWAAQSGTGAGDVASENVGTTVDNTIARWHGTGGQNIQASVVTIADTSGNIAIPTATAKITLGAATEVGSLAVTASGDLTLKTKAGRTVIIGAGGTGATDERISIDAGSGAGGSPSLAFLRESIGVAYIAVAGDTDDYIPGTVAGDLVLRTATNICFSSDQGTSIGLKLSNAGVVSFPTATASLTLGSTNTGSLAVNANGALTLTTTSGQDLTITTAGAKGVKATGTGAHVFGTTNTVTLQAGALVCTAGFGCNTKAAQTAVASGGALAAYGTGAFGLDSGANMSALHAMVVAIRGALVANGIMS